MHNCNRHTQQLNPHIASLTCRVKAIVLGMAKCMPLPASTQETKSNTTFLEGLERMVPPCKALKVAEVAIPTFPFNLPIWWVRKTDGSWRMAVNSDKLNQVVTPPAVAVADVVSLLEQISAFPCAWYVEIYLAIFFSMPTWAMWPNRFNGIWRILADRDALTGLYKWVRVGTIGILEQSFAIHCG